MAFNYTSLSDIRLKPAEEQFLESIDKFSYSLNGFANLGNLHHHLQNMGGGVVLSDKKETRPYSYEITIGELNAEILKTKKVVSKLRVQFAKAHKNKNLNQKNLIEKELGILGRRLLELEETKTACPNAGNGKYKIEGNVDLLGKYDSSIKQVILYYNSIFSKDLLAVVYVHEMMHAYLDCGVTPVPEIEEPIVEYGMLCFFKAFGDTRLLDYAQKEVENKQHITGIAHYGFGHCIFMNPNGVKWLNDYLSAKPKLSSISPEVKRYLDFWRTGLYPNGQEQACLQALYDALHPGTTKSMMVKKRSALKSCVQGSRRYKINSNGSYSMYQVIERFSISQLKLGRTIFDLDQEIKGYTGENSRTILSDNKTKVFRWSYRRNGKVYEHFHPFNYGGKDYYSTKEWKGGKNDNFSRLKDGINQNYPNFQIEEI